MAQVTFPSDRDLVSANELPTNRLAMFQSSHGEKFVVIKTGATHKTIINLENGCGGFLEASTFVLLPEGTLVTLSISLA